LAQTGLKEATFFIRLREYRAVQKKTSYKKVYLYRSPVSDEVGKFVLKDMGDYDTIFTNSTF